jgi:hypothetical protein
MENLAGYVLDHTSWDQVRWHRLAADERGPYFVSPLHGPRDAEFLKFIRQHRERSPGCNPLDGREHSLSEIARWIGNTALAARFIGLGVILGVFDLTSPSEGRSGADRRSMNGRPECAGEARFRLVESRPREAIERPGDGADVPRFPRRPGPRRPRYTRCARSRRYGISRTVVM